MSRRVVRQVDELVTPRSVRRLAKRKGISEEQAYALLYDRCPAMPGQRDVQPRIAVQVWGPLADVQLADNNLGRLTLTGGAR